MLPISDLIAQPHPRVRVRAFPFAILLIFIGSSAVAAAEATFNSLTKEEVKASLAIFGPEWEAKVAKSPHPRVYFKGDDSIAGIHQRAQSNRENFAALQELAASIVRRLPRQYVTPESLVQTGKVNAYDSLQELWQRDVGDDIITLAFMSLLENRPGQKEALREMVLTACRYPTWGRDEKVPNMDLACAHLARAIALAWDWHPDLWKKEDRSLILATIRERAGHLMNGLYGQAYWAAQFANNHNHTDVSALATCGVAFYGEIAEAAEWLAAARLSFQRTGQLMPEDGSSHEGMSYWSYGLNVILLYIEATRELTDSAELYESSYLRQAASFRLHAATPGLDGVLPWGDAVARDSRGPQDSLFRLASEYRDGNAQWLARSLPFSPRQPSPGRVWIAFWEDPSIPSSPSLTLDHHAWVEDVAMSRSGWGKGDYLLTFKSGYTNRNHSHLDAGALALAFGTDWLLTSPGYGQGAGQPGFWRAADKRWDFYSNATEAESTLLIDGRNQRFDREARGMIDAILSSSSWTWMSADLTQAYQEMQMVRRDVLHRRGEYVLVLDKVDAEHPRQVEWLAQLAPPVLFDGRNLETKGEQGTLRVQLLEPEGAFASRAPASPIIDNPRQTISTYAAAQIGRRVRFSVLLQPTFGRGFPTPLQNQLYHDENGSNRLELKGTTWQDTIIWSDHPTEIHHGSLRANARLLATRNSSDGVRSFVAVDAKRVSVTGIEVVSTRALQIAMQQLATGSWILDSDKALGDEIHLPNGWARSPWRTPDNPAAQGGESFRYILAPDASAAAAARSLLGGPLDARPAVATPIHPLAKQPALPETVQIVREAEDYDWQRNGTRARIVNAPFASEGKALAQVGGAGYGNSTEHRVIWRIVVPQDGRYSLQLRYCADQSATFALLIDGSLTDTHSSQIAVPSTGGWGERSGDWQDLLLTDPIARKPIVLNLSRGEHTLAITNVSNVLTLDRITLRGNSDD